MTSNRGLNHRPHDQGSDIWRILSACIIVGCTIAAAILLSALSIEAILPADALKVDSRGQLSKAATWGSLIVFQITVTVLIVLLIHAREPGRIMFTFALSPPRVSFKELLKLFGIFVVVLAAMSWLSLTFFYADAMRDLGFVRQLVSDTPMWVAIIALVIGAPVSEEILFRGFLMNQLADTRLQFSGAAIVATAGWTLLHVGYSTIGLVEVFVVGLLLSWLLWRTGSLWVPMFLHAAYNATMLAVIVLLPAPAPA